MSFPCLQSSQLGNEPTHANLLSKFGVHYKQHYITFCSHISQLRKIFDRFLERVYSPTKILPQPIQVKELRVASKQARIVSDFDWIGKHTPTHTATHTQTQQMTSPHFVLIVKKFCIEKWDKGQTLAVISGNRTKVTRNLQIILDKSPGLCSLISFASCIQTSKCNI